jgi:hypothetical protein
MIIRNLATWQYNNYYRNIQHGNLTVTTLFTHKNEYYNKLFRNVNYIYKRDIFEKIVRIVNIINKLLLRNNSNIFIIIRLEHLKFTSYYDIRFIGFKSIFHLDYIFHLNKKDSFLTNVDNTFCVIVDVFKIMGDDD